MKKEIEDFIAKNEVCRIATAGSGCQPHVVPVSYVYLNGKLYISTDYGTRKLKNITENPKVAAVIDTTRPQRGVLIQGEAKIIERGDRWKSLFAEFYKRFEWARRNPWNEGEAPFIEVTIKKLSSWGFGNRE